jgi:hypothetical protein
VQQHWKQYVLCSSFLWLLRDRPQEEIRSGALRLKLWPHQCC